MQLNASNENNNMIHAGAMLCNSQVSCKNKQGDHLHESVSQTSRNLLEGQAILFWARSGEDLLHMKSGGSGTLTSLYERGHSKKSRGRGWRKGKSEESGSGTRGPLNLLRGIGLGPLRAKGRGRGVQYGLVNRVGGGEPLKKLCLKIHATKVEKG